MAESPWPVKCSWRGIDYVANSEEELTAWPSMVLVRLAVTLRYMINPELVEQYKFCDFTPPLGELPPEAISRAKILQDMIER